MSLDNKLPMIDLNAENSPSFSNSGFSENILRPKTLAEYVGQKSVTSKLQVFLEAARNRGTALDHVLLSGPPGLGKTTLAYILAQEMGGRLHQIPAPSIERAVDLLAILSNVQKGDVLFIDEIHRLGSVIEESLYPAMEDFQIQVVLGEGAAAQSVTVPLQRFTLVGATTQPGKLSAPLRDRFGIPMTLDFYETSDMVQILRRSAGILKVDWIADHIEAIALRSRGTPRIGNRLLARVRDYLEVRTAKKSQKDVDFADEVQTALDFLEVDSRGLQPLDRRYLKTLNDFFKGGPAGIEAIAASLAEDRGTLEETVEPYLLKEGFIIRSPRGRVLTDLAYLHLGLSH
jgi:holliday junction DNA helicase RuvB